MHAEGLPSTVPCRFGLLGPNGAGKTTTLAMLTGALRPDGGEAVVDGVSVTQGGGAAFAALGFCPQTDPLLEFLTAQEQLALYARLKVRSSSQLLLNCKIKRSTTRLRMCFFLRQGSSCQQKSMGKACIAPKVWRSSECT